MKIAGDYRTVEWQEVFGGDGNDEGSDVLTVNNEIVAVGSNQVTGGTSGYFLKVDSEGNLLADNLFGEVDDFEINAIKRTPDKGFAFIGSSTFEQNSVIVLAKTNSDGKLGQ
jgi:hypothetical protein